MRISIWRLLKDSAAGWRDDNAARHAAALAYYTVFSIAPLLVIVIAVAGLLYGQEAAEGRLVTELEDLVGSSSARAIQGLLASARQQDAGILATAIGFLVLFLGATRVFAALQGSLNEIWSVTRKPGRPVRGMVKSRLTSFALVLAVGFVLLVSLAASAALAALTDSLRGVAPVPPELLRAVNFLLSFSLTALLFAAIYKVLPDVTIGWRDVWIGALVTATLFSVGRFLIGLYLGRSTVASSYGAAGSFVVILLWVYYSAQILFFGAEFTRAYAERYGSHIEPAPGAMRTAGDADCATEPGRPA